MGYYIETDSTTGKADWILEHANAEEVAGFIDPEKVPPGFVPVIVVDNGHFEAAAIAYSRQELNYFQGNSRDRRPRRSLLVQRGDVVQFCPSVADQLEWP